MNEQRDLPHSDLLSEIEAFCVDHDMSKSRFGANAVGDPKFIFDLEDGRECRRATVRKVRRFIASFVTQDGDAA